MTNENKNANINVFVNCWSFMEIAVYPHKSACGPISLNSRLIPGIHVPQNSPLADTQYKV